jgi:hypothetical protein
MGHAPSRSKILLQPRAVDEEAVGIAEQIGLRNHLPDPVLGELAFNEADQLVRGQRIEFDAAVKQEFQLAERYDLALGAEVEQPRGRKRLAPQGRLDVHRMCSSFAGRRAVCHALTHHRLPCQSF